VAKPRVRLRLTVLLENEKLVSTLALLGLVSEKRPNPAHHAQALSLGWKVRRAPERDGVQRLAGVACSAPRPARQAARPFCRLAESPSVSPPRGCSGQILGAGSPREPKRTSSVERLAALDLNSYVQFGGELRAPARPALGCSGGWLIQ